MVRDGDVIVRLEDNGQESLLKWLEHHENGAWNEAERRASIIHKPRVLDFLGRLPRNLIELLLGLDSLELIFFFLFGLVVNGVRKHKEAKEHGKG